VSQLWQQPDAQDEAVGVGLVVVSRRCALSAMVLSALLLAASYALGSRPETNFWARLGLWAMFAWSLVVLAYSVMAFWRAHTFSKRKSADFGLTDPLTGLPNRKGLLTELERYDVSPREFGRRVRLIDIDLLNLDRVNYEFGQMVGDAVLQDLANVLRSTVPEGNLVGRLGGDEFLVIMPQGTASEAEKLANSLREAITNYRLNLGERGEVHSLKANISVAAYVPEQASLHETVISAKSATAHGSLPEMETDEGTSFYHVPRVTLGAFAVHRWQKLSKREQDEFKLWKRELNAAITERMASEIVRLLDEKAEANWVDFVTAVPAPGGIGGGRTYGARHLAQAVAKLLGVPYRDVMRADASGPESRSVEPAVDAVIDKGDGVLLVSDVISSGILERRCLKKLSAAGAHVQVVAWAAY